MSDCKHKPTWIWLKLVPMEQHLVSHLGLAMATSSSCAQRAAILRKTWPTKKADGSDRFVVKSPPQGDPYRGVTQEDPGFYQPLVIDMKTFPVVPGYGFMVCALCKMIYWDETPPCTKPGEQPPE